MEMLTITAAELELLRVYKAAFEEADDAWQTAQQALEATEPYQAMRRAEDAKNRAHEAWVSFQRALAARHGLEDGTHINFETGEITRRRRP